VAPQNKEQKIMTRTYIKVFLKSKTSVVDCLQLMKNLIGNDCVEKARVFSGIFPETRKNAKSLTPVQLRLQQKYRETERFLALLQNKGMND
jgi:hypothetical protein